MACQMPRYRERAEKRGHPAFAAVGSRAIVAETRGQTVSKSAAWSGKGWRVAGRVCGGESASFSGWSWVIFP